MPEPTEVDISTQNDPPTLADQYDLGDTSPDPTPEKPAVDSSPQPKAAATPQPPPSGSVSDKPSRYLVQMAHDLGVSDDEVKGCDRATLELLVSHLNRQASAARREATRDETVSAATDRSLSQKKAAPAAQAAPDAEVAAGDDEGLGINESEYDPGLVATLKELKRSNKALRAELDALKPDVQTLRERETHRSNLSLAQRMDKLFTTDSHIYGEGTRQELADDSAELQRRKVTLNLMQDLKGSPEERYARAKEILYGVSAPAAPKREPAPKNPVNGQFVKPAVLSEAQERWVGAALPKPTQRVAGEPAGARKAEKTAARIMKESGSLDDSDENYDDAFPS